MEIVTQIIKWGFVTYAIYSVGRTVFTDSTWSFIANIVKQFTVKMLFLVLGVMTSMIAFIIFLYEKFTVLQWSWTKYLFDSSTNIMFAPTNTGNKTIDYFIGLPFLLLLLIAIPRFAYAEEKVFRSKVFSHGHIFMKSFFFGIVHCIVGIPLAAGLGLTLAGLLFGYAYRYKFLLLLRSKNIQPQNDELLATYYVTNEQQAQLINRELIVSLIEQADEKALQYSTAYHVMWNWILVTLLILSMLL